MLGLINPGSYQAYLRNWDFDRYPEYIDSVKPPVFMTVDYPIVGVMDNNDYLVPTPNNLHDSSLTFPSYYPSDLKTEIQYIYNHGAKSSTPANYNDWIQNTGHTGRYDNSSNNYYNFNGMCKDRNKQMYVVPQIIFWHYGDSDFWMREPLNSETGTLIGIALCNGAKGILPYSYESGYSLQTTTAANNLGGMQEMYSPGTGGSFLYHVSCGISDGADWGYGKRDINFYGENKWDYLKDLYAKMKTWGPVLANSTTTGYSVTRDGANKEFISDIMSIVPGVSGQNPCTDSYQTSGLSSGPYLDCPDERFWEMGFFSTTQANTKYFMMVNRRCVPAGCGYAGDKRILRIKFNPAQLTGAVNWKLTDVLKRSSVVFSRNYNGYVDLNNSTIPADSLGVFQPGESKLFKLVPVLKSGGTLVENDTLSGVNITCEDTVITNGYNLFVTGNSTISFTDSAAIIMAGGTLTIGSATSGITTSKNTFQSTGSGHKWKGIQCTGCNVKIYNAKFQDVHASDTGNYSVNCINCPLADIRYNTFISADTSNGGVSIAYTSGSGSLTPPASYINYNTFTMNDSRYNAVQVQGFGGLTAGVYLDHNTMTSNGYATGIFLSTVTGGVIKNNSMTGFNTGINMLLSSADIYGNTISNSGHSCKDIFAAGLSSVNLAPSGGTWLGGRNLLQNDQTASTNIEINNSAYIMTNGNNTLTIDDDTGSYHLFGYFMDGSYEDDNRGNCYFIRTTAVTDPYSPKNNLTDYSNNPAVIKFLYTCDAEAPSGTEIVDIGNGLYDTIPQNDGYGGGESGGKSSITNYEFKSRNFRSKIYL